MDPNSGPNFGRYVSEIFSAFWRQLKGVKFPVNWVFEEFCLSFWKFSLSFLKFPSVSWNFLSFGGKNQEFRVIALAWGLFGQNEREFFEAKKWKLQKKFSKFSGFMSFWRNFLEFCGKFPWVWVLLALSFGACSEKKSLVYSVPCAQKEIHFLFLF